MDATERALEILGLGPDATPQDVKQTYRDLAKVWHPDRFPNDSRVRRKAEEKLKLFAVSNRQRAGEASLKMGLSYTINLNLPATSDIAVFNAIFKSGTFVLGTFTAVREFSELSTRAKVLTPVAQFLGALCALITFPPLVTQGATRVRRPAMRTGIGALVKGAGYLAWAVFGIWGFVLCLAIVNHAAGFWGVVAGFFILPVTFVAAPWYAGVALGDWFPLLICYGGGIGASILVAIGSAVAGDET